MELPQLILLGGRQVVEAAFLLQQCGLLDLRHLLQFLPSLIRRFVGRQRGGRQEERDGRAHDRDPQDAAVAGQEACDAGARGRRRDRSAHRLAEDPQRCITGLLIEESGVFQLAQELHAIGNLVLLDILDHGQIAYQLFIRPSEEGGESEIAGRGSDHQAASGGAPQDAIELAPTPLGFGQILFRRECHHFHRGLRERFVDLGARQVVQHVPRPLQQLQLPPVLTIFGQTPLHLLRCFGIEFAVEIGDQLLVG